MSFYISVEAVHIGTQLCQHGYFFPVNDLKNLTLKDDSSLYRFQVSIRLKMVSKQEDNSRAKFKVSRHI